VAGIQSFVTLYHPEPRWDGGCQTNENCYASIYTRLLGLRGNAGITGGAGLGGAKYGSIPDGPRRLVSPLSSEVGWERQFLSS